MFGVLLEPNAFCTIIGARRTTYKDRPAWALHLRLGATPLPDKPGQKMLGVPRPPQLLLYCARYVLDEEVQRRTDTTYSLDGITLPFASGARMRRLVLGIESVPDTHIAWSNPYVSPTPPEGYPINVA